MFTPPLSVRRAVLGRVSQEFVEHQRQNGEGGWIDQHVGAGRLYPRATLAEVGGRLRFDQVDQARRAPIGQR